MGLEPEGPPDPLHRASADSRRRLSRRSNNEEGLSDEVWVHELDGLTS